MACFARHICVLFFIFVGMVMAGQAWAEVILRPNVMVSGQNVTLGDLFDNVPANRADKIVARAPAPGRHIIVNAEWLQKVARSAGLGWRPESVFDQAVIVRNGVAISEEVIRQEILAALTGQDLPDNPEIDLDRDTPPLMTPIGASSIIAVRDIRYDSRQMRFTAVVEAPAGDPEAQRMTLSGMVVPTIDVPVPARAISRGEIIRNRDLTWRKMRLNMIRRDALTDIHDIIGFEARTALRQDQVILSSTLQRPILVKRNAQVMIILRSGGMSLSARGRALDQGGAGDVVRVINNSSKMTIEAVVEGPNTVSVGANTLTSPAN